ncbi:MAG: SprT-like domain-containing protein [Pyrinomonadaceae bacterium]
MINGTPGLSEIEIRSVYEAAFARFDPTNPIPDIHIEFYPYVGINHTIRRRDGRIFVRIGDLCREMPLDAHRGLAEMLVAKLLGRRVPKQARAVYAEFASSHELRLRATANRRVRGRKLITTAKGSVYDLDEMFDSLNERYFREPLPRPTLTWSTRRTYRILGHHDATHDTIVISLSLDDARVPRFVVEYVLFHEMLHIAHPMRHSNGRRYFHTPAFRRDERKFAYYREAEDWIEDNVRKLKRRAKRK